MLDDILVLRVRSSLLHVLLSLQVLFQLFRFIALYTRNYIFQRSVNDALTLKSFSFVAVYFVKAFTSSGYPVVVNRVRDLQTKNSLLSAVVDL